MNNAFQVVVLLGALLLLSTQPSTAVARLWEPLLPHIHTDKKTGHYCTDIPTPDRWSCREQKIWGKCDEPWMIDGGWCRCTCGDGDETKMGENINSSNRSPSAPKLETASTSGAEEDAFCFQNPGTGPCRAAFPRWMYNMKSQTCQPFIYGGCEGNENNFESFDECVAAAVKYCGMPRLKRPEPVNLETPPFG